MVSFARERAPRLEICADSVEYEDEDPGRLTMATINEAVALTNKVGARWSTIYVGECAFEAPYGDVRLRVEHDWPGIGALAVTGWNVGADGVVGYAVVSVFVTPETENVTVLAHELLHAQGVGHVCHLPGVPEDGPECSERFTGHIMFPSSDWMGRGVDDIPWVLNQVCK